LGLRKTTKITVVRAANIWTENKTHEIPTEGQLTFGYMENILINNIIELQGAESFLRSQQFLI